MTIPLRNTNVVTVFVLVRTGSKHEKREISGISHFLEHMLFKGTSKRETPLRVAEDLDKVGGLYNAFTGDDYTGYYAKVNASHLPLAVEWVSDIYLNSLLPEKEVEKEKGVVKEEINMRYDNPAAHCQLLFGELLYGDQPAGRDIAGSKETVSSLDREKLLSYMRSQYVSENTLVIVAGNIKEEKVREMIGNAFSDIRKGEEKEPFPVEEEQDEPRVLNFKKETDQTHFALGARGFNSLHSHRYTQEIIAALLGGMMSSRLFVRIREEMGLAYYIRTSVEDNPETGFVVTQAGVDNKRVDEAVKAVREEYRKITKEKISPEELKKAKEHLKGKMAISLESSDSLAYFHGTNEILERRTYTLEEFFELIDSVTAEDILDASKKIFVPENLNLSIVGPHEGERFKEMLA